jgi:putative membrane protein
LGIAAIGREIENPFGKDVNDLDMEGYIRSLTVELDILTSMPPPQSEDFIATEENCPLGPMTDIPYSTARNMSMEGIFTLLWRTNSRNSRDSETSRFSSYDTNDEHEC